MSCFRGEWFIASASCFRLVLTFSSTTDKKPSEWLHGVKSCKQLSKPQPLQQKLAITRQYLPTKSKMASSEQL